MTTEQIVSFDSGSYRLNGTLHLPVGPQPPLVIGSHGLFANRNSPKQIALARACNNAGLAYFRFDHRGCGDSQGEFTKVTSLQARCRDLDAAIMAMQAHNGVGPLAALFGSSFGGSVVLSLAAERATASALITYAAPINSRDIRQTNIRDNSGNAPSATMLTEALEFDIASRLKSVRHILIAHSRNDETVPIDHAQQIHRDAGQPKKLVIFPGGDHRMSDPAHQQQFETLFIQWITTAVASVPTQQED